MANKMLIDATHPEETRVVVTRGNRVEEFDYESASRKQLRGNIYLAKVARIEPSLQAAFVNYGGNRHGFLAFAEIHSDYYQIPLAVREAMQRAEAEERAARGHGNGNGNGSDFDGAGHSSGQSSDSLDAAEETAAREGEDASARGHEGGEQHAENAAVTTETLVVTDETGPEAPANAIALEAALPPVVYEEFVAAVERANEARDEIPAHPDDVETSAEDANTSAATQHTDAADAGETSHQANGGTSSESEGDGDEGGVVTVPEPVVATPVEVVGSEDAMEEVPQRVKRRWRNYKIQEVIKRNQIVLIQVVKEERGTKGAALTTFLSLAGRYTVLMPNTASGGGISRKITVPGDRKRLKEIAQELEVPEGMGLIIRTAGASRTKAEIKRDFEYLLRLWENVRDLTLRSKAPCLVYEEGDLIKRSIRDLYNKDIDEIIVSGDDAYREAKDFMRMLMPSHAKNVQHYREPEPLFTKFEVERQLNQMFSPVVTLKSGGYIVLNQTEALVAIDVNSGRATREYSIEDTALKTNLEASEEIARQVRLRDLAGLIVIDFIDMEERRNNRAVERRLKECLRHDRARIQVGHISHFGLLEMSRQRLRQGVVEVSTMPCPTCQGVGHIRSTESVALMILRSIEDHLRTQGAAHITAGMSQEAALYILNHKRTYLRDIETRYGVRIVIMADEKAHGAHFSIERGTEPVNPPAPVAAQKAIAPMDAVEPEAIQDDAEPEAAGERGAEGEEERRFSRRRRRRRGRGRGDGAYEGGYANGADRSETRADDNDGGDATDIHEDEDDRDETSADASEVRADGSSGDGDDAERGRNRHRRRGRRGGRRYRSEGLASPETAEILQSGGVPGLGDQPSIPDTFPAIQGAHHEQKPQEMPIDNAYQSQPVLEASTAEPSVEPALKPAAKEVSEKPTHLNGADTKPNGAEAHEADGATSQSAEPAAEPAPPPPPPAPKPVRTGPPKKGWWQRTIG
jgi:ribonuclease E